MTPFQLISVIEDADARSPRGRRRIILELTSPTLLGEKGRYLGIEVQQVVVNGSETSVDVPVYGYTRRQCQRVRDAIYAAAREDLGDAGD